MAPGEKRKWQNYLLGLAIHNMDGPLGRLVRVQGVGRARDVVRGQDGHEDGSNMMRVPSRQLSAPVSKALKEGGCA